MDQNKCVALLTAIDLGNLTRAAEQLGTPSPDSVMSSRPWRQSWVFPFWSAPVPGVRPTEDCQRILPLLRDLDRKSRQLEQEAADIRGLAVGTVSLATFPSISRFWLPEILRDFAQHYPGITVSIRESGQEELDEWLREGSVDLAFCSYHENSQNHWFPSWRMKSGRWSPTGTLWRAVRSSPWPSWPANPSSWKTGPMTTTSPG